MRPSSTKYDALRSEFYLEESSRLDKGVTTKGRRNGAEELTSQVLEAARSPQGPFALYELGSRGPTLRELFEELFDALSQKRPDYGTH